MRNNAIFNGNIHQINLNLTILPLLSNFSIKPYVRRHDVNGLEAAYFYPLSCHIFPFSFCVGRDKTLI